MLLKPFSGRRCPSGCLITSCLVSCIFLIVYDLEHPVLAAGIASSVGLWNKRYSVPLLVKNWFCYVFGLSL